MIDDIKKKEKEKRYSTAYERNEIQRFNERESIKTD